MNTPKVKPFSQLAISARGMGWQSNHQAPLDWYDRLLYGRFPQEIQAWSASLPEEEWLITIVINKRVWHTH
jgi:hypothetical protein